ncbi:YhaN family protein [Bacillus marasmi]|uniref:YhaN family protein n=1 Tax=Bacillus marasmi TaxID=1926279 RepID=UPI0011C78DCC|nr:YhaN family protein [Bacillus marasmi]
MRFDYLNLKAFGHFTEYHLSFDSTKNFHLLYGPNEAGKSTTLRSINDFLYGFPQRTTDGFLHNNSKLRIEGQLRDSKGETLAFIRRKGRKDTVLDLDGNPMNENVVEQFIHGMPNSQFSNMFALDHVILREGGESILQSGGSVGESIFSAATGINILRKVMDNLSKETSNLYKKSGSNPKLNKLLQHEKELQKKMKEAQLKIHDWKELEKRYQQGKKEIDELIDKIKNLRHNQNMLKRIRLMLPRISKRKDLNEKIEALGEIPNLPDNIVEIRRNVENQCNEARKVIRRIEGEIEAINKQLGSISIPEKVLSQATIIDSLYRDVKSYQNNIHIIPELEGTKVQIKNQVISIMKEIDSVHADLENIDLFRLSAEKKETIKELIKQKPLLDSELRNLENENKKLDKDLEKKTEEFANIPELPVIEGLEAAIDKVKRAGAIEENIGELKKDCSQKEREIKDEISDLALWKGTYEEFLQFSVPILTETVKKFVKEQNDLENELDQTKKNIKEQKNSIELYDESIRKLDSLLEIPSQEQLLGTRSKRNDGWNIIRTKLQTGEWDDELLPAYTNGQNIEVVYEEQVRQADQLADTMRLEAEKVGEKNKLLSDIEQCKKKISGFSKEEVRIQRELLSLQTKWEELWQPLQISPLSPGEMKEWLDRYQSIHALINEYETSKEDLLGMEEKSNNLKGELLTVLNVNSGDLKDKSLEDLLTFADNKLKSTRELINKENGLKTKITELNTEISDNKHEIQEQERKLERWTASWNKAIQNTSISTETPITVAEKLIQQYEDCTKAYEELIKIEKDKDAVQNQISIFNERVEKLFETVGLPLNDINHDIAVNQLYSVWQQARNDKVTHANLTNQMASQQTYLKESKEEFAEADSVLNDLFKLANCKDIDDLKVIEDKFVMMKNFDQECKNIEEDMLTLGEGKSIQGLIDEAMNYDSDKIVIELDEIDHDIKTHDDTRSELEQAYGVIKKEYEDIVQGNNTASVQVEQERNSIHEQIASVTDEYIQLKLASILLQRGIEDYRNKNQNPIIKRAGEIFKKLTLQSFTDLTVDYDDKDQQILMGVRKDGEKVMIDGMSDGTKDQLYLSLRIASIEKYVAENEPIPFIVDDILIHFDDKRSKETLKILKELSMHTQIIFFTHHSSLLELMEEVSKKEEFQVIEINNQEPVPLLSH